ncbi:MAG: hypothetical protein B6241_08670 [Spirochaetaceae bacterium 4572_59]|nr:MAG: hypothetical protein B6241_08670 [Spirochaetaceae bacterium 4572_59]
MLLIHPPQVRNCEPPVALTRLAGALKAAGEDVTILDGALEAFLWLCDQDAGNPDDPQAKRVRRKKSRILDLSLGTRSMDAYKKQISDIKLLAGTSAPVMASGVQISPADYQDPGLSPLKSQDLIYSWHNPEKNLFYPWFSKRLSSLMKDGKHSHAGISINYLSQALTAIAMCGYLKKEYPSLKIQLGGGLINSWIKGPSRTDFLNMMAHEIHAGEGEEAIVRFCGRVYRGPGIPDFKDLYEPAATHAYLSPGRILPFSASTGCSWKRCTFCSEKWEDNPYCEIPALETCHELAALSEQYQPDLIHLCDSEISRQLLQKLMQQPPGPAWYGFSRFIPEMTGSAYCRKLAASGCTMLCMGLESGDQAVLDSLKKGIRLEQVSHILENLKEAGIRTFIYIMFGTPAENREEAYRTRDFVLAQKENIDYLNISIFNMPAGSGEAAHLQTHSFYEGDLSLYTNFKHPGGWDRGKVRTFLNREIRKVPELKEILKKTPPVFTTNHAPFLPL